MAHKKSAQIIRILSEKARKPRKHEGKALMAKKRPKHAADDTGNLLGFAAEDHEQPVFSCAFWPSGGFDGGLDGGFEGSEGEGAESWCACAARPAHSHTHTLVCVCVCVRVVIAGTLSAWTLRKLGQISLRVPGLCARRYHLAAVGANRVSVFARQRGVGTLGEE